MSKNKLLIAACTLFTVASAQATHTPQAPQQPRESQAKTNKGHAHHKRVDVHAPTAKRKNTAVENTHNTEASNVIISPSGPRAPAGPAAIAGICNINAFATSNSSTLITEIKTQGADCVNELFNASASIQASAYSSDNMYAVANHVKALSDAYTGGGSGDIEAMFLFLRAGYYVEFYNDNVTFVSWVKPAIKAAIDAFVNNANFYQNNDAHGKTMSEVIITMDSSEQQDVYLPVIKEWLNRWNPSYGASWNMRSAVNNIFTVLFRGQYNANFVSLVSNDTTLVSRLNSFTQQSWMINSESEYLIANAARELGRLKMPEYGTNIQATVDSGLNSIFANYQMVGNGDAVWLGAADTANYYGDCNTYNICGYGAQLEAQVLSQIHECSSTIKIRSQALTAIQQASACSTLGAEEIYFHTKTQSGNAPIPGDNNTQLQINIFDNSTDYGKYAGPIFDMDTNNGGMYLEGDPSVAGNVPNFIAYEADYAEAPHYVWNLEHEYVHYLDGRFDLFGNFNTPTEKVVWWAEGVAEYVANQNNNQAAIDTIHDGSTYTLSSIFETTYDGFDQDRIYRWGYLAVRFMFENHFSEVKAMIAETRAGNWTAYKARLNTWVSNYSNEFTSWTQTVTSDGGTNPINTAPTAIVNGPYAAQVNAAINFSANGSSDAESTITYNWNFGDGASSTLANPSHSYDAAGNYTAILTVTDVEGLSNSASATVSVTSTLPPEVNEITNGGSKSGLSATTGQTTDSFFINVPNGASNLVISISGGNGDADLFTRQGSAPTSSSYNCRPYQSGNNETCTVANPAAGQWFMNINAYSAFTGVTLTASFDAGQSNNVAPTAVVNGPYIGDQNTAISFSSNGSTDSDGSIASYSWNFGDGATSTAANPSHTYTSTGSKVVTLTVTDNLGLTSTASTTATVNAVSQNTAPVVYINGPYTGDKDVEVSFSSAGSYDNEGSIVSYSWSFGDGSTSSLANPTHAYSAAGTYTVTLSATDNGGLTETATTTVDITGVVTTPSTLTNGTAKSISGSKDSETFYTMDVPAGATELSFVINGGSGDADLYVRFGSAPTANTFDCRPYAGGNNETCTISNVQAGTYHIMVSGYSEYSTSLVGNYTGGGNAGGNVPDMCAVQGAQSSGTLTDGSAICLANSSTMWLNIAEVNAHNSIAITIGNGTGDVNVDFSNTGWPTSSNTQASSANAGNSECIYLTNLSEYYGYMKVSGNADGASMVVDFDTAGCR